MPTGVEQPGCLTKTYIYQYDKSKKYKFTKLLNHINIILNNFFLTFYGLISKPVYLFTQNKLTIYINYYIPNLFSKKYKTKKLITRNIWKYNKLPALTAIKLNIEITKLIKLLSNLLNLKIELQLNQLKYPYHDSNILAKFIALNTNKKRFRKIFNTIIKKALVITKEIVKNNKNINFFIAETNRKNLFIHNSIPAVLTGLKVKRIVPKRTVKKKEIGGFNKTKDSIVDYAIFTNKNKRGSYSVKVWTTSKICL